MNNQSKLNNTPESENLFLNSIKVLTDLTRNDMKRLNNIENNNHTENYSNNQQQSWNLSKVSA